MQSARGSQGERDVFFPFTTLGALGFRALAGLKGRNTLCVRGGKGGRASIGLI